MMLKLSTWLLAALAAGALMAGCGSGSSTSSTSTVSSQTAVPPAGGKQLVASCEQAVRSQPGISSSAKAKLEATCKNAASGGQAGRQKVAHEVCIELLEAAHVPAGPDKDRALAACNALSVK